MALTQSIELMAGLTFLVFGLSYLLNANIWGEWYKGLALNPERSSIIAGMAHLIAGAFILAFHWVWQGTQSIVTACGVILTLEGTVYLLCPGFLKTMLNFFQPRVLSMIRVTGLIISILAIIVLYGLISRLGV